MSVITAYKCDTTGKLFEDKAKYQKHIRSIANERRIQRKIEADHKSEIQWWHDNFWNKVKSLAQLQAAILHHSDVFAAQGVKNYGDGGKKLKPTPILTITKFSIWYSDKVSNSHNCPHDGVTNWASRDDAPRGYPGWKGRLEYVVQSHKNQLWMYPGGGDMWEDTRIHTGSGGGGGGTPEQEKVFQQSFGYGMELFASDWPAMAAEYEKARNFNILKDEDRSLDQIVNEWYPESSYNPT